MRASILLPFLHLGTSAFAAVIQTCAWKDGSLAQDYFPCTNATATSGNCCHKDDACTENGMCYGGVGLVYRGACINTWGGDCLTYCDDITANWANFFPCAYAGSGSTFGPQTWWCGAKGTEMCTQVNGTHIVNINPGGPKKIVGQAAAMVAATGTTASGSTQATTSSAANTCPSPASSSNNMGALIGLGVVIGVLVLLGAASAVWGMARYRRLKREFDGLLAGQRGEKRNPIIGDTGAFEQGGSSYQPGDVYTPEMSNHASLLKVEMDGRDRPEVAELGGGNMPNRY